MKPFDKAAALCGEPVVTRDGKRVINLVEFPVVEDNYTLYGVVDGTIESWTAAGAYYDSTKPRSVPDSYRDLFMAPTTVKGYIAIGTDPSRLFTGQFFATHVWPTVEEAESMFKAGSVGNLLKVIEVEVEL
jgi:hypothetical protein